MSEEIMQQVFTESGLSQFIEKYGFFIEGAIEEYLPESIDGSGNDIARGKRALPLLTLLGAEISGGNPENMMPAAVAVEFINLGSLILQDNANKQLFNGVGLLNAAYGLVFVNHGEQPDRAIKAHAELTEFVESFCEEESNGKLDHIPALLNLSVRIGAVLAGADFVRLNELTRFAEFLGEAWQLSGKPLYISENAGTSAVSGDDGVTRFNIMRLCEDARSVLFDDFAPSGARGILLQLIDFVEDKNADQDQF